MINPLRILKYIFKLIKKNPIKVLFLIAGILLLYPIYNLDYDLKQPKKVINSFKNGFEYYYVIIESSSNFKVVTSDVELLVDKEGMILVKTENSLLLVSWIGFVVCLIALIVGIFSSDDDINWSFRDNYIETLHDDIVCEIQEFGNQETYYYTIDGKLILKSNTHKNRVYNEVKLYYESPNLYLKFETKKKKRNNKLEEILHK